MRIALVSTYSHPVALGLRYVSSALKAAGHRVEMLFMSSKKDTADADFEPEALEAFVEHCRAADLIGMSLMTNTFRRAKMLTETLRRAGLKAPIIWGGTHPTIAAEQSLEIADMVCIGEGEEPVRRLAERLEAGRDPSEVPSIGFRAGGPFGNGHARINPVLPLEIPLDEIPFPDYGLDTHWVIEKGRLVPARPDNLRGTLQRLRVESTRGCPFSCAFCNNTVWQNLYRGKGSWVRLRSNENVITEMRQMTERFPSIHEINIVDDLFFVRDEDQIDDFVARYRRHINLPLELDAFPNTVTERKVASLARLPIALISMGIQSGSPDTLRNIYHRNTPTQRIAECIDLFSRYRLSAEYHYIISNPYEPEANLIETMRFAASHHKGPAVIRIFPLMFYPGSPLYERAVKDGLIGQKLEDAYTYMYSGKLQRKRHDYLSTWLHLVLQLRNVGVPSALCHRLIDVVTHPLTRKCIDRRWFPPVAFGIYQVLRKLYKNLIFRPIVQPIRHLRGRRRREPLVRPEDELSLPRNNLGAGDPAFDPAARLRESASGPPASDASKFEPSEGPGSASERHETQGRDVPSP